MNATHAVLRRSVEDDRWSLLEWAPSLRSAKAKAEEPRSILSPGDLILAIETEYINPLAIPEYGKWLYFVGSNGKVEKAPAIPRYSAHTTWFLAWEGPDAKATDMLRQCGGIDRKILVLTACAIARSVLDYVPQGEDRPRIAIETAEAWTRGEATLVEVKRARDAAAAASASPLSAARAADAAASAAYSAASAAYSAAYSAARAAYTAAVAMPGDDDANLKQLSSIVREFIPLHAVLESLS